VLVTSELIPAVSPQQKQGATTNSSNCSFPTKIHTVQKVVLKDKSLLSKTMCFAGFRVILTNYLF
jgi:hypothetical protein